MKRSHPSSSNNHKKFKPLDDTMLERAPSTSSHTGVNNTASLSNQQSLNLMHTADVSNESKKKTSDEQTKNKQYKSIWYPD